MRWLFRSLKHISDASYCNASKFLESSCWHRGPYVHDSMRMQAIVDTDNFVQLILVPQERIELSTNTLSRYCSTTELLRHILSHRSHCHIMLLFIRDGIEPSSTVGKTWSGRWESNPPTSAWKAVAQPIYHVRMEIFEGKSAYRELSWATIKTESNRPLNSKEVTVHYTTQTGSNGRSRTYGG